MSVETYYSLHILSSASPVSLTRKHTLKILPSRSTHFIVTNFFYFNSLFLFILSRPPQILLSTLHGFSDSEVADDSAQLRLWHEALGRLKVQLNEPQTSPLRDVRGSHKICTPTTNTTYKRTFKNKGRLINHSLTTLCTQLLILNSFGVYSYL